MIFRNSKSTTGNTSARGGAKGRGLIIMGVGLIFVAILILTLFKATVGNGTLIPYKSKSFTISIPKGFSMVGKEVNNTSTIFAKTEPSGKKIEDEVLTVTKYTKTDNPTQTLAAIEAKSTKTVDGKKVAKIESEYVTLGKTQSLKISSPQNIIYYIPSDKYIWRISADFQEDGALSKDVEAISKSFSTNNQK